MKKTISINLGGYNFYIEEEAYVKLDNYLKAVRAHFAKYPDSSEIVADMEGRLAEQLQTASAGDERRVITVADVEKMITLMGTVKDLAREENLEEPTAHSSNPPPETGEQLPRRLYRNPDDQMIAGVCSGLAAYFGVDPTIVRVLFVVGLFFGGFTLLLYIILMLVMPEASTATEKMQMQGKPLTIASIEEVIKKNINLSPEQNAVRRSKFMRMVRWPFEAFAALIRFVWQKIVPFFGKLAGLIIIILTSLAMATLLFTFIMALVNAGSPYLGIPLNLFITSLPHYILMAAIFLSILIPLIFIQRLGIYFLGKRKLPVAVTVGLVSTWFLAVSVSAALLVRFMPAFQATAEDMPNFKTVEKVVPLPEQIEKLNIQGTYKVHIIHSTSTRAVVRGPESALYELGFSTQDGHVSIPSLPRRKVCVIFCGDWRGTTIDLYTPNLPNIRAGQAVRIETDHFAVSDYQIELYDVASATLNMEAKNVTTTLADASRLELKGKATRLYSTVSDVSRLEATLFPVEQVTVFAGDASRTTVQASVSADVTAKDVSRIYVNGTATTTAKESDAARVVQESAAENP